MGSGVAFRELPSTPGLQGDPQVTAGHPASLYLGEHQHLQHISLGPCPAGVAGRGMRERVSTGVPATGCPQPTTRHSRGSVPPRAEIPPGEGQHGASPCTGPEPLTTISLWTFHKGSAGRGRLWNRTVGARHSRHHAGDGPGPAPTSVFRSSS